MPHPNRVLDPEMSEPRYLGCYNCWERAAWLYSPFSRVSVPSRLRLRVW